MPRLIQICASQNDLFGLDDDGRVYQYNFNTSQWRELEGPNPEPHTTGRPSPEVSQLPRTSGEVKHSG
jgi:hypothetical protein